MVLAHHRGANRATALNEVVDRAVLAHLSKHNLLLTYFLFRLTSFFTQCGGAREVGITKIEPACVFVACRCLVRRGCRASTT